MFLTINKLIKVDGTSEHSGKEQLLSEESMCVQPDSSSVTAGCQVAVLLVDSSAST